MNTRDHLRITVYKADRSAYRQRRDPYPWCVTSYDDHTWSGRRTQRFATWSAALRQAQRIATRQAATLRLIEAARSTLTP